MDITRNMNGARALAVGAGLALALAMGAARRQLWQRARWNHEGNGQDRDRQR